MVWIKRLAPVVVIGIVILVYFIYQKKTDESNLAFTDQYALITARIWLAKATYRNTPDMFVKFRDSLLTAENVAIEDIRKFIQIFQENPENYIDFTKLINIYVDSLAMDTLPIDTLNDDDMETLSLD